MWSLLLGNDVFTVEWLDQLNAQCIQDSSVTAGLNTSGGGGDNRSTQVGAGYTHVYKYIIHYHTIANSLVSAFFLLLSFPLLIQQSCC
jgi:hypothetical protein